MSHQIDLITQEQAAKKTELDEEKLIRVQGKRPKSYKNDRSADRTIALAREYYSKKGMRLKDITLLTYYRGQEANLTAKLKQAFADELARGEELPSVSTVRMFQEKQNKVEIDKKEEV